MPHIKDLVYVCDKAYTKEDILKMEGLILFTLNFDLVHNSALKFLDRYTKVGLFDERNYCMARYLIEIALLEY